MARILVAEDDADISTLVEFKLRSAGHDVSVAADGQAALDLLDDHDGFDVAVLDVMMPQVDGFEVCRRATQCDPRPLIVMLTARGREADVEAGFDAGADDYIVKPFSPRELLARIERLLQS